DDGTVTIPPSSLIPLTLETSAYPDRGGAMSILANNLDTFSNQSLKSQIDFYRLKLQDKVLQLSADLMHMQEVKNTSKVVNSARTAVLIDEIINTLKYALLKSDEISTSCWPTVVNSETIKNCSEEYNKFKNMLAEGGECFYTLLNLDPLPERFSSWCILNYKNSDRLKDNYEHSLTSYLVNLALQNATPIPPNSNIPAETDFGLTEEELELVKNAREEDKLLLPRTRTAVNATSNPSDNLSANLSIEEKCILAEEYYSKQTTDLTLNNPDKIFITSILPLSSLDKIKKLDLSNQAVSDIRWLLNMKALNELNLSTNYVESVDDFISHTTIKNLNLSSNMINKIMKIPSSTIEFLDLSNNPLKDISILGNIKQERFELILTDTEITKCPFTQTNTKKCIF
ncbi:MAG: hypothetical protein HQK51_21850, partial [Oligoflexia bacterium]|nr:hypothetical protein [Oligoflexia bacterium]